MNERGQRSGGISWTQWRPKVTDTPEDRRKKLHECAWEMARVAGYDEIVKVADLHELRNKHIRYRINHGAPEKFGLHALGKGPEVKKNISREQLSESEDSRMRANWCSEDYDALNEELRSVIRTIRRLNRDRLVAERDEVQSTSHVPDEAPALDSDSP